MSKFIVTWPSGLKSVESSTECETLDSYAMQRWGFNSMEEVQNEFNVAVVLASDEEVDKAAKEEAVAASKRKVAEAKTASILAAKLAVKQQT